MSIKKVRSTIKRMRELSDNNIPFSFSYLKYNSTKGISEGVKHVNNAELRTGYSSKHKKSDVLLAYKDLDTGKNRNCYIPLIIKFNDKWLT